MTGNINTTHTRNHNAMATSIISGLNNSVSSGAPDKKTRGSKVRGKSGGPSIGPFASSTAATDNRGRKTPSNITVTAAQLRQSLKLDAQNSHGGARGTGVMNILSPQEAHNFTSLK
jgi:hypothetical protein